MELNPYFNELPPESPNAKSPKSDRRFSSLRRKFLLSIAIWVLCVLSFISVTVSVTWRLEDRGMEINRLGQLGKQVYRIVAAAAEPDAPHLPQQLATARQTWAPFAPGSGNNTIDPALNRLIDRQLAQMADDIAHHHTGSLMRRADVLAANIDHYARQIEADNTRSIRLLRIIRLCLITLIGGSALLYFLLLKHWVLRPLAELNRGIEHIGQGDLAARVHLSRHDEFTQAAAGFNQMATRLQYMYTHLEDKVSAKTAELSSQKQAWKNLYQLTAHLHQTDFGAPALDYFIEKIRAASRADAVYVRLPSMQAGPPSGQPGLSAAALAKWMQLQAEDYFNADGGQHPLHYWDHNGNPMPGYGTILLLPLAYRRQIHGIVALQFTHLQRHSQAQQQMWLLLCSQLAIAWQNNCWIARQQQLAVLEERNLIAQGLHDSIAQSLSFLKIQFQILHKHPALPQDPHFRQNIALIRNGLDYCYEDVRELLHNFRTRIGKHSFGDTIRQLVARYRQQTGLSVHLQLDIAEPELSEQQQIQVLFILQETLANIRKHAHAQAVWIDVTDGHDFTLSIRDNGCGFDYTRFAQGNGQSGHIGLSIIRERAQKIDAGLHIESTPEHGTRISLRLPHSKRQK